MQVYADVAKKIQKRTGEEEHNGLWHAVTMQVLSVLQAGIIFS